LFDLVNNLTMLKNDCKGKFFLKKILLLLSKI